MSERRQAVAFAVAPAAAEGRLGVRAMTLTLLVFAVLVMLVPASFIGARLPGRATTWAAVIAQEHTLDHRGALRLETLGGGNGLTSAERASPVGHRAPGDDCRRRPGPLAAKKSGAPRRT